MISNVSSVNINNNQQKQRQNSQGMIADFIGASVGMATMRATKSTLGNINLPIGYTMVKTAHSLNDDENNVVINAYEKLREKSGLKNKCVGTHIYDIAELNKYENKQKCAKNILADKALSRIIKNPILRDLLAGAATPNPTYSYITGTNAVYKLNTKNVCFAKNNTIASAHEAGHAIICNGIGLPRLIDNMRQFLTPSLRKQAIFIGLLFSSEHKPSSGKPLNPIQKIEKTVHDTLGVVSAAMLTPTLINEWQASKIGEKYIRPHLPQNLYNKVIKSNRLGFTSYVLGTITTGVATHLAVKAKDKTVAYLNQKMK